MPAAEATPRAVARGGKRATSRASLNATARETDPAAAGNGDARPGGGARAHDVSVCRAPGRRAAQRGPAPARWISPPRACAAGADGRADKREVTTRGLGTNHNHCAKGPRSFLMTGDLQLPH